MDGKNHSLRRKLADKDAVRQVFTSFILTLISSFFANYERTLPTDFQFAQMDLARIRVLRTLINSIAKNLHKLQICLRFYYFYKKLDIQSIKIILTLKKNIIPRQSRTAIFYNFVTF